MEGYAQDLLFQDSDPERKGKIMLTLKKAQQRCTDLHFNLHTTVKHFFIRNHFR